MYIKIPGSNTYSINKDMVVKDLFNNIIQTSNKKFSLTMFNKKRSYSLKWLYLISHYEVGTMPDIQYYLNDIEFRKVDSKYLNLTTGNIMVFKEPIYYYPGYRIVPNYVRYAISVDGIVIDTITNTTVEHVKDHLGYINVYIHTPDRNGNRHIRLHRLLALAWIPNDNYQLRNLINHIDGKKDNNKLINLEWCNTQENIKHAHGIGLINDNTPMKIRHRHTGEIKTFRSTRMMSDYLGMSHIIANGYVNKLPGYLYNDKYEIKLLSDDTPWFYENPDVDDSVRGKSIFLITVFNKDTGETKIFNNTRHMCKKIKVHTALTGIDAIVNDVMTKRPEYTITYKRYNIIGPYHVFNTKTKKLIVLNSFADVQNITNINRNTIRNDMLLKNKYIYKGQWIIQDNGGTGIYDDYVEHKSVNSEIIVTNKKTGKETKYNSIRECSRKLSVSRKAINYRLLMGKPYMGYEFRTA